jgi:hypothetical protein
MKILIDMNLSPSWATVLNEANIEAVHWSELGPANTPDPAMMVYAASNGFVILTNDLDFARCIGHDKQGKAKRGADTWRRSQAYIDWKSSGAGLAPNADGTG